MTQPADILIAGGGMAGACAGYFLARDGARVQLLERETQPGYHATGRSAALFSETYGPPLVRKLSTASRAFLNEPPDGFAEHPLLTPRGLLQLANDDDVMRVEERLADGRANGARVERLDEAGVRAAVPILRPGAFAAGVLEPGAMDIDVAALLQGFLRGFRRAGGRIETDAEIETAVRTDGRWKVTTRRGACYQAPILINAAGAWADVLAEYAGARRIGLIPKRRTAVMIDLPPGWDPSPWPLAGDFASTFYCKPDAGRLLLSPADETPVPPQDVQPEIEDVATVIERFMEVTTLEIDRPGETWAGLRSFVADGEPVVGYAPMPEGFFWLAGQGGYGIQTAAAMGRLAAALVQGADVPPDMARLGLDPRALAPERATLEEGAGPA